MGRDGDKAERWAKEQVEGTPTVNSGATFCDADMKTGGFGGRMYEIKSSTKIEGVKINKKAIQVLCQRALKELREPVFLFMNKHNEMYAVVPIEVFIPIAETTMFYQQELARGIENCVHLKGKGNNITVDNIYTTEILGPQDLIVYQRKDGDRWVILDADIWLTCVGDQKKKKELENSNV